MTFTLGKTSRTEDALNRLRSMRPRAPRIQTAPTLDALGLTERRSMYSALGALGAGILIGVGATLLVQKLLEDDSRGSTVRRGPTLDTMERRAEDVQGQSQLVHVLRSR